MYNATVTVFNYYESSTTGVGLWYPHVLSGVDLNTDKGAILKKYGSDSTDNAELHIVYELQDGKQIIRDADGKELPWLPPKEWSYYIPWICGLEEILRAPRKIIQDVCSVWTAVQLVL